MVYVPFLERIMPWLFTLNPAGADGVRAYIDYIKKEYPNTSAADIEAAVSAVDMQCDEVSLGVLHFCSPLNTLYLTDPSLNIVSVR
jgi:hypothetical protein